MADQNETQEASDKPTLEFAGPPPSRPNQSEPELVELEDDSSSQSSATSDGSESDGDEIITIDNQQYRATTVGEHPELGMYVSRPVFGNSSSEVPKIENFKLGKLILMDNGIPKFMIGVKLYMDKDETSQTQPNETRKRKRSDDKDDSTGKKQKH